MPPSRRNVAVPVRLPKQTQLVHPLAPCHPRRGPEVHADGLQPYPTRIRQLTLGEAATLFVEPPVQLGVAAGHAGVVVGFHKGGELVEPFVPSKLHPASVGPWCPRLPAHPELVQFDLLLRRHGPQSPTFALVHDPLVEVDEWIPWGHRHVPVLALERGELGVFLVPTNLVRSYRRRGFVRAVAAGGRDPAHGGASDARRACRRPRFRKGGSPIGADGTCPHHRVPRLCQHDTRHVLVHPDPDPPRGARDL